MNTKQFIKYWDILKKNYQDKTHNKDELYTYYSIFKDYDEEKFKQAIKQVLKYQKYFPRIDEIVQYLPEKEDTPLWFDTTPEDKTPTKEEEKEMEELLSEICNIC